jgi:hypothetical protein
VARLDPAPTPRHFGWNGLGLSEFGWGTPLNKANVHKRLWMPLLERAAVRYRDMYSLRWTCVSLPGGHRGPRASECEAAFNVLRVIGHARSTIVDTIYAHTVDSALPESARASRSESD